VPVDFEALLGKATRVRGVLGAVVVDTEDGLVVADSIMEGVRVNAIAALTASMYRRLVRTTRAAGKGRPDFVQMQAEGGVLIAVPGDDVLLVVVGEPDLNVGLVKLELMKILGRHGRN
jgi:predicted regulator of Ras-like GTPase activity (Roadblock/LC7/MglB family)